MKCEAVTPKHRLSPWPSGAVRPAPQEQEDK
jgi:hypothetical protein